MKLKLIEKTAAPKTKKKGHVTIAQKIDDITVLNAYNNGTLCFRHCVRLATGEHATWYAPGYARQYSGYIDGESKWTEHTLLTAYGFREWWEKEQYRADSRWNGGMKYEDTFKQAHAKDEKEILDTIKKLHSNKYWTIYKHDTWSDLLDRLEKEYDYAKRETAKERRERRIRELMDSIVGTPSGWHEWATELAMGPNDVAVYNATTEKWCCSACGELNDRKAYVDENGQQVKTNRIAVCPHCGRPVKMLPRHKGSGNDYEVEYNTTVAFLQDLDESMSVIRHFRYFVTCTDHDSKDLDWHETVRIVMYKGNVKKRYQIYYNYYSAGMNKRNYYGSYYGGNRGCESWQLTNPASHRMTAEYLFPDPNMITAALTGTDYEHWIRAFTVLSAKGLKVNYNNLMACADTRFAGITELLCKGRFYNLLVENAEYVWPMSKEYYGHLKLHGTDILSVMGLSNMQTVNRLRDMNGGLMALTWLTWAEENDRKISQAALTWLIENDIGPRDPYRNVQKQIFKLMSPEQVMHYIQRQQAAGYSGMKASKVISQWDDYMSMAARLGKKTGDELIYKPADLKAKHDKYVIECEKHRSAIEARQNREHAKEMAKEMRKKFPTSEAILKEIKPLFEWENESYKIIVPKSLADIILEGTALHHCAGATDRYFDRICQHETYICFLRKKKKPKEAYYTIEVEPGGVIRQHRGMYDEEPEIEKVKPALREWQKEIKKRMKKKDKERAKESERKRVENIAYLREHIDEKNNRRVLQGLEEDLMAL